MIKHRYKNEPTISEELIAFLLSARSTYLRKKILWEMVQERLKISNSVYRQNIYRLKKKGLIKDENEKFFLTEKGISLVNDPYKIIKTKPIGGKKVIIIFDIPETKKKTREWLRFQIKNWNFKMIQRSVWVGNGPMPKEFIERLKSLGVGKDVKVFNVQSKVKI